MFETGIDLHFNYFPPYIDGGWGGWGGEGEGRGERGWGVGRVPGGWRLLQGMKF